MTHLPAYKTTNRQTERNVPTFTSQTSKALFVEADHDIHFFLSCEHAGNLIPTRYKPLFKKSRRVLETHRGYDPGAFAIAQELSRLLKTKLFFTKISRLVVDMNRSEASDTLFSPWTNSLNEVERERIVKKIYRPYRDRITSAVEKKVTQSLRVIHLGIHSFSPHIGTNRKSCDIGILFDPKSRSETKIAKALKINLERLFPDLGIRLNFPYRGNADGLTTDLRKIHKTTQYAGLEIEFNQALLKKLLQQKNLKSFASNFAVCAIASL